MRRSTSELPAARSLAVRPRLRAISRTVAGEATWRCGLACVFPSTRRVPPFIAAFRPWRTVDLRRPRESALRPFTDGSTSDRPGIDASPLSSCALSSLAIWRKRFAGCRSVDGGPAAFVVKPERGAGALLVAQHGHRVHGSGTEDWKRDGKERRRRQRQRCQDERARIEGCAEQGILQQPSDGERQPHADA
jgi:hypothetical protein